MLDLSAEALGQERRGDAAVTALRVGAAAEQRDLTAMRTSTRMVPNPSTRSRSAAGAQLA